MPRPGVLFAVLVVILSTTASAKKEDPVQPEPETEPLHFNPFEASEGFASGLGLPDDLLVPIMQRLPVRQVANATLLPMTLANPFFSGLEFQSFVGGIEGTTASMTPTGSGSWDIEIQIPCAQEPVGGLLRFVATTTQGVEENVDYPIDVLACSMSQYAGSQSMTAITTPPPPPPPPDDCSNQTQSQAATIDPCLPPPPECDGSTTSTTTATGNECLPECDGASTSTTSATASNDCLPECNGTQAQQAASGSDCIPPVDPPNTAVLMHYTAHLTDSDGFPLNKLRVSIHDDDGANDPELASTTTDISGLVDFIIPCDQDPEASGQARYVDPVLKFSLTAPEFFMQDENGYLYSFEMPIGTDYCQDTTLGTISPSASGKAEKMLGFWNAARRSADRAYEQLGDTMLGAGVEIRGFWEGELPNGGTSRGHYLPWANKIEMLTIAPVETLEHEYGHYVHDMIEGDIDDFGGTGPSPHGSCSDTQSARFALVEGFAEWWEYYVDQPEFYPQLCGKGIEHESDVLAAMFNWCDPSCGGSNVNFKSAYETTPRYESLSEPGWNTKFWAFMGGQQSSLAPLDAELDESSRALTWAGEISSWHINNEPTWLSFSKGAAQAGWHGEKIQLSVQFEDPDTLMHGMLVGLQLSADDDCFANRNDIHFSEKAYLGEFTAPQDILNEDARLCAAGIDELGKYSTPMQSSSFKIDTKKPLATAWLQSRTLPTEWSVGWDASDEGAGLQKVQIYEKKPGKNWALMSTYTYSDNSSPRPVVAGFDAGDTPGTYCYAAVATDKVSNRELGPSDEACRNYPV